MVSIGHLMKFLALIPLIHMDLAGEPHTMCIHLMACLVDGKLWTMFHCPSFIHAAFDGLRGCHCPFCWTNGILQRPLSSYTPMRIGDPLCVMSMSSSLFTVSPSLVKIEMFPLMLVLPHSSKMWRACQRNWLWPYPWTVMTAEAWSPTCPDGSL